MMMQTTTDMMAAWRQTGGAPSAAGRQIDATCIDVDASVSAAAVTFRVPGCVAEDCIDVDASVSAAAISWHGGVCHPAGAA
ncbi:hypothetical protein [Tistrella sp.]|jgi:hypothetical protein|uniref:hypothetical protein n=1 Tax=Tistrella sp. TaxID=2024861 RepID=UPI0025D283EE|nr:hypothetical protein [Tistrella sp.]